MNKTRTLSNLDKRDLRYILYNAKRLQHFSLRASLFKISMQTQITIETNLHYTYIMYLYILLASS